MIKKWIKMLFSAVYASDCQDIYGVNNFATNGLF